MIALRRQIGTCFARWQDFHHGLCHVEYLALLHNYLGCDCDDRRLRFTTSPPVFLPLCSYGSLALDTGRWLP